MDISTVNNIMSEEFCFLKLNNNEIENILKDLEIITTDNKIKDMEKQKEMLESLYYSLMAKKITEGDYEILINYLRFKRANKKNVFYILGTIIKKIELDFTLDMGTYLIDNYDLISNYFEKTVDYLNRNKKARLTDFINEEMAYFLFDLYCDIHSIKIDSPIDNLFNITQSDADYYSEDSVSMYLHEIARYPLLDPSEEKKLFEIMNNENNSDKKRKIAREKLINSNLRWVVRVASQYTGKTMVKISFSDLIQEGNIGLMKAVDRFDISKGYKLSTYATWWIRQTISRYIGDTASLIKMPVHQVERIRRISKASQEFLKANDRDATNRELAELTGYSIAVIREAKSIMKSYSNILSLDEPVGEDDSVLADFIPTEDDLVENVERRLLKDYVADLLKCLDDPRQVGVIKKRFGLEDGTPMTLEEIGAEYNITRERVRQIEAKALRKLRSIRSLKEGQAVASKPSKQEKDKYLPFLAELRKAPKGNFNYVMAGLTNYEKDLLYKKVGEDFKSVNEISSDEERMLTNIIIPKMRKRYLRITYSTFTYDGIFEQFDRKIGVNNFYILTDNEKELLLTAYGEDLTSQINESLAFEDERRIVKFILPKMISHKVDANSRKFTNYEELYQLDRVALPGYLVRLFLQLFPYKNIKILEDDISTSKAIIDGFEYILSSVLKRDEFDFITNLFKVATISEINNYYSKDPRYLDIISKLREAPHVIRLSNKMFKLAKSNKVIKGDTYFYSFFNKDEIKKLPIALKMITFEDILNISKVFTNGLDCPVYRDNIRDEDYRFFIDSLKNIKAAIKRIDGTQNFVVGNLYEVYRYCEYLFGEQSYRALLSVLTDEEQAVLTDCLSVFSDISTSIKYASVKEDITEEIVIIVLKRALYKILKYFETDVNKTLFNSSEVELMLKLSNNKN